MRTLVLLSGVALAAVVGAQDSFQFQRKYAQGEKDTFVFKMSMEAGPGSLDMEMTQTSTVVKVHENGDADIETEIVAVKLFFNGQETPMPAGQRNTKSTTRFTKFGVPVSSASAGPERSGPGQAMAFMRLAQMLADKPIAVGESVPVEYKDPNDARSSLKGTIKLEKVQEGIATLVSNLEVFSAATSGPIKMTGTTLVDTATSKLVRSSGTLSNLPQQGGLTPSAVQFSIERKAT